METWNFIFLIISAIGSLATVGTFIFLFRRDSDKQQQIDKLASISMALKEQIEVQKDSSRYAFLPSPKLTKYDQIKADRDLAAYITNTGKPARVISVRNLGERFSLVQESAHKTPFYFASETTLSFTFNLSNAPNWFYDGEQILFHLYYEDEVRNIYKSILSGKVNNLILSPPMLATPEEIRMYNF